MLTDIRALADHFLIALPNINNGQSLGIKNVEATPSIHHHLREMCLDDDGVDDERIALGVWDLVHMISSIEGDGVLRPFEEEGAAMLTVHT